MAVLKYLETGDANYRARLAKDEADFNRFKARYDRLVVTETAKELGQKFAVLYQEFTTLGKTLMDQKDEQDLIFSKIGAAFENIDKIVDDKIQANLDPPGADGIKKTILAGEIEVNIAEVGVWLGNYLRTPNKAYKERIFTTANNFLKELGQFKELKLTEAEKHWTGELEKVFKRNLPLLQRALLVHDSHRDGVDKFLGLRAKLDNLLADEIQLVAMKNLGESKKQAAEASAHALRMTAVLVPLFILCSIGAALLMIRCIKRPLKQLLGGYASGRQG